MKKYWIICIITRSTINCKHWKLRVHFSNLYIYKHYEGVTSGTGFAYLLQSTRNYPQFLVRFMLLSFSHFSFFFLLVFRRRHEGLRWHLLKCVVKFNNSTTSQRSWFRFSYGIYIVYIQNGPDLTTPFHNIYIWLLSKWYDVASFICVMLHIQYFITDLFMSFSTTHITVIYKLGRRVFSLALIPHLISLSFILAKSSYFYLSK